jgi:hypothetical protein
LKLSAYKQPRCLDDIEDDDERAERDEPVEDDREDLDAEIEWEMRE